MNYFTINSNISITSEGIMHNTEIILPLVLEHLFVLYDYSGISEEPATTYQCSFKVVGDPSNEALSLSYIPCQALSAIKELQDWGIKIPPRNRLLVHHVLERIFKYLEQNPHEQGTGCIVEKKYLSAHSGWRYIKQQWVYLTSGFGVTKNGIDRNYSCISPDAYLYYDETLKPRKAYEQLLQFLEYDFNSVAPLLASTALSLINPLRKSLKLYPAPGLLLTGPTGCGKTQLATHMARIFTDKANALEHVFILQNGPKELKKFINGISDSTIIIDDIRRSPSYSLNQNTARVLDSFIRECFSENSNRFLLPIITGEENTASSQLQSWRNRIIIIDLGRDTEFSAQRRELISKLHKNPLLVRTVILYFIKFIAIALSNHCLNESFSETETDLNDILERMNGNDREIDNLFLSYWAFKIFCQFGISLNAIRKEDLQSYMDRYINILKKAANNHNLQNPEMQAQYLFLSILEKLRFYEAPRIEKFTYRYSDDSQSTQRVEDCYGYHALINYTAEYEGVLIENTHSLWDYPSHYPQRSLLILEATSFDKIFAEILGLQRNLKISFPFNSSLQLLKALRDKGLLLGEPRYESEHRDNINFRIRNYPCFNLYSTTLIKQTTVLVFSIPDDLYLIVKKQCTDEPLSQPRYLQLSLTPIEKCSSILKKLI